MALAKWKRDRIEWARGRGRREFIALMRGGRPPRASREELEAALRTARDAWEALTGRSQDLPDGYIELLGAAGVRKRLDWYLSDEAKALLLEDVLDLAGDLAKT